MCTSDNAEVFGVVGIFSPIADEALHLVHRLEFEKLTSDLAQFLRRHLLTRHRLRLTFRGQPPPLFESRRSLPPLGLYDLVLRAKERLDGIHETPGSGFVLRRERHERREGQRKPGLADPCQRLLDVRAADEGDDRKHAEYYQKADD